MKIFVFFGNDDYIRVVNDGEVSIATYSGLNILSISKLGYDDVSIIEDYFLCKVTKNNKWGLINEKGQKIVPCKYDKIENESKIFEGHECFVVINNSKYGLINTYGKEVLPCKYEFSDLCNLIDLSNAQEKE